MENPFEINQKLSFCNNKINQKLCVYCKLKKYNNLDPLNKRRNFPNLTITTPLQSNKQLELFRSIIKLFKIKNINYFYNNIKKFFNNNEHIPDEEYNFDIAIT